MAFQFLPSDEVAAIRSRLDHPIVDGDGRFFEGTAVADAARKLVPPAR